VLMFLFCSLLTYSTSARIFSKPSPVRAETKSSGANVRKLNSARVDSSNTFHLFLTLTAKSHLLINIITPFPLSSIYPALFDVHRDAVPPEVYYDNIDGHDVTKLKFVVGNTNPRFQTNLEFAKQLKAAADKKYPGIIQGILVISSDFNQDLAPRAMLIEAGAHTNEREHAEQGIAMFAETLPAVLGSPRASEAPPTPEESSGAWKAVILGIILVAAAVFGYLYMNTGSIEGATNQLRNFFSRIPLRRKD
jgi:hypothetical protein